MKVVYASSVCSKRRFFEVFPLKERMPGQQAQKYHRLMLEGLARNGIPVMALTSPPITPANHRAGVKRVQPDSEEGVDYLYLTVLNYPVIKNIVILAQSFLKTCGYLHSNKDAVVICDVLNFSVATGALLAARLFRRTNTGIVTDIPSQLSGPPNSLITWAVTFAMMRYDSYVFLTKEMDSLVNRRGVPFLVIEGQVDINMKDRPNEISLKHPQRVCLYAGAVDRRYGLEELVLGFLKVQSPDAELHIYGTGDYAQTLIGIAQKETRVKYLGPVPNDQVIEAQLQATLLINPRPSTEEFAKYSFPSKNMEYIASGTPLLTTRLPGMPQDYLPYVYVLQDESPEGIAEELETVLAVDRRDLHFKGKEAKEFALKCKSNVVQAARVAEFIASCQGTTTAGERE